MVPNRDPTAFVGVFINLQNKFLLHQLASFRSKTWLITQFSKHIFLEIKHIKLKLETSVLTTKLGGKGNR